MVDGLKPVIEIIDDDNDVRKEENHLELDQNAMSNIMIKEIGKEKPAIFAGRENVSKIDFNTGSLPKQVQISKFNLTFPANRELEGSQKLGNLPIRNWGGKQQYKTNYKDEDPLEMLKKYQKNTEEIDDAEESELPLGLNSLTSNEQNEIVNMLSEFYEKRSRTHSQCPCMYCKQLRMPFLIRNDLFASKTKMVEFEAKHKAYLEKFSESSRTNPENSLYGVNNIFFKQINLGEVRVNTTYRTEFFTWISTSNYETDICWWRRINIMYVSSIFYHFPTENFSRFTFV
mgnify:CR=1 FL=1